MREKVGREQELFIAMKNPPRAFPSTRGRGEQGSEGGVRRRPEEGRTAHSPDPGFRAFHHHEKHEAKGRKAQGAARQCLPWAAAGHPTSREAPSAERLGAGCSAPHRRGSRGCTPLFGMPPPPCPAGSLLPAGSNHPPAFLTGFEIQMKCLQVV